ncbi:hypothetical protein B0H16DRAFT_1837980 [Mycena metata]|uniref:CxC1-like cysteine cluster associated with KDZ transposases domain-containing protein n=1 Tax=Mycena metata TaxID=1033252 RepID=A0AAD7NX63_9AGAR|nr:hypothetical protein B0H16DRAFT_1837980 [Mycena metata]
MAGASGSESDDESDSGLIRTFDIPDMNATRKDLVDALKNAQLEMGRLVVENRALRSKLAVFEQTNKKQQSIKGPDVHGYLGGIKTLGKKFGFMQEPWITLAVFTAAPANGPPPHATPQDLEAMFKTPKVYAQYLTCAIYEHVPHKYHDLVDWTSFPNFGNNFVKYVNAGRSSAVNTLKANLPKILAECKITSNKGDLLYHPGEDRNGPPSAYPPIFYTAQKKNIRTQLLNPVLPMALRCMIFGPASIADKGNVKPLSTTLGYLWQLPTEGLTIGSICFTLTALISVLSGVDTQFEEKGKTSGIPFQTYFRGYKKLLMKTVETPGVQNILKVWTTAVFKKVAAAKLLDEPVIPDDKAEAAAEAEFAAAMEGMTLGEDPAVENLNPAFDWGQDDVDNASESEQQIEGGHQGIDQEEEEQELEEEEPVPAAMARGRGGGAGRARGGARAVVLDSDEDLDEDLAVVEPRRTGRRRAAVPAVIEPPAQVQKKVSGRKRGHVYVLMIFLQVPNAAGDAPPQPAPTGPAPEAAAGAAPGCEERWKNLADDSSKRTWAIYDETGVFVCLCRHGFILLVADMFGSKYALSVCNELIKAFPAGLGNGYDIGCGSSSTIWNSPLGAKALLAKFRLLVGAFHGQTHNCLCQLLYLATYVFGLGLEDLEGCERFFSRSNALATSVRYASIFHRKQTLAAFFKHFDAHEIYANLSKFLVNNYWQALDILAGEPMFLSAMQLAGITDLNEFPKRLDQEFTFLKSLMGDSEEDTLQMEYYQRLVNFADRCVKLELVKKEGSKSSRTVIRHAQENYDKAYAEVQESEIKMGVVDRWEDTFPEWAEAAHLVSTKRYRLAVLKLECLVVQRMFELTKMNLSQTGYKLRKHIAKALQVRSQAIRNALKSYNTAAKSMVPPARQLRWDEVIEYAFLSDFDLLRKPAELSEIQRAREEIQRCNIEIHRVITSIRDEKIFLMAKEDEVRQSNPGLAWCIRRYRFRREQYNSTHMQRFQDLAKKAGERFTGTLEPGVRLSKVVPTSPMEGVLDPSREAAEREAQEIARQMEESGDRDEELEINDDLGERIEEEQLAEQLDTLYLVSEDA